MNERTNQANARPHEQTREPASKQASNRRANAHPHGRANEVNARPHERMCEQASKHRSEPSRRAAERANEPNERKHTSKTKVLIEILLPQRKKEVSMTNKRTHARTHERRADARPHERASRRTPANEIMNDLNFRELFSMKHLDFQELFSRNCALVTLYLNEHGLLY